MPHISVKMLKGRTEEQKQALAKAMVKTLAEELHCSKDYVTLTIEDYDAKQWQEVFKNEVSDKESALYVPPKYDPKSLL